MVICILHNNLSSYHYFFQHAYMCKYLLLLLYVCTVRMSMLCYCIGVSGQNFSVSIVVNPNVAPYTVGDNLMLTCMVDPMPNSNVTTYAWNCIDCFADGSTSSMINRSLTDMDTSNISCLASINGTMYRSDVFDLQVTGSKLLRD